MSDIYTRLLRFPPSHGLTGSYSSPEVRIWEVSLLLASRADETRTKSWWRREESEYSDVLKTRTSLIFRADKNAGNGEIAPNWNVSGTWNFQTAIEFV